MPCYKPLKGYISRKPTVNGKFPITFKYREGWIDRPVSVPCGKCIGCRKAMRAGWTARIVNEASLFDKNCFITLTYDDFHLPPDNSLRKSDFVLFMKRLREHFKTNKIRFFQCGEYGDKSQRPHHHCILFGFDFPDRHFELINGRTVECSESLSRLWGKGFVTIADFNENRASYVARYVCKKYDAQGELLDYDGRIPPYATMSRGRRPDGGIGFRWFEQFASDVYANDKVILSNGMTVKPPRFYDERFCLTDEETYLRIKGRRIKHMRSDGFRERNRPRRLREKEEYQNYILEKKRMEDEAAGI